MQDKSTVSQLKRCQDVMNVNNLADWLHIRSESGKQSFKDGTLRTKADYLCSIDKDIGAKEVVDHCKAVGVDVVSDTVLIAILRSQDRE
jgi:hypothetical protein